MLARSVLFLSSLAAASTLFGQHGPRDPEFRRVPFDEWFTKGGPPWIKWAMNVSRPQLSAHQRLSVEIEVLIDGGGLANRVGRGQVVVFVQLEDAAGKPHQNHATLDLQKMNDTIRKQDVSCVMSFFVLPGDYRLRVAVFDSATSDHSVKQEKLHVAPLKNDPLEDMWHDLPPIEFTNAAETPDSWYLPAVHGRLHLPVAARSAVRVEVIVNLTPSERLSGSGRVQNRDFGALIPALKAISQIDLQNGSMNIELLDLSRRRVVFHQEQVRTLDWPAMKNSLADTQPGVIDLKSLEHRRENADFFVKEVGRIVGRAAPEPAHVSIVLSGPVEFEGAQDLQPTSLTPAPGGRVFYIRYRVPPPRPRLPPIESGPGPGRRQPMGGGRGPGPGGSGRYVVVDQLESTIKALAPRLFDVETAEQFRKALAAILGEISRM
jgi:hypothetical protein